MVPDDEEVTARLLQIAGPRADVPADRTARIRRVVHERWTASTSRRRVRRRIAGAVAALAAAAVIAIATWIQQRPLVTSQPLAPAPPVVEPFAHIERIDGTVDAWLTRGAGVHGQWLFTGSSARMALRLADGSSLRVDVSTGVRLRSASVIELAYGAIYIDSGPESRGLEVRTPVGVARDVGTQFEVRLRPLSLRVRVRTGLVELRVADRSVPARPGTELTVIGSEAASRPISASDAGWQWAAQLAPAFDIEGRPLAVFIGHLAHEQGWDIRYADAGLARDASGIMLHGSVEGLAPEDALGVVLRTSGLSYERRNGEFVISRSERRR